MPLCSGRARSLVGAALAAGGSLAVAAAPAAAHIGTSEDTVAAGGSTTVSFTVGHGCDGSPTTALAFQVPESVISAKPHAHPGWDIAVERAALETPVEQEHGDPITERPAVIRFTARAGSELPDAWRDGFTINFRAPDVLGETLFFKVVQTCEVGETRWIEEWDGQGEEPEHPAPSIEVVAAATDAKDATETAATDAFETGASDEASNGMAVAALVAGALGLVTGVAALLRSRRRMPG